LVSVAEAGGDLFTADQDAAVERGINFTFTITTFIIFTIITITIMNFNSI
jgi:hypothetical protein